MYHSISSLTLFWVIAAYTKAPKKTPLMVNIVRVVHKGARSLGFLEDPVASPDKEVEEGESSVEGCEATVGSTVVSQSLDAAAFSSSLDNQLGMSEVGVGLDQDMVMNLVVQGSVEMDAKEREREFECV